MIALTKIIKKYDQNLVANACNVQNTLCLLFFECVTHVITSQLKCITGTVHYMKKYHEKMRFIYQ